ncbi:MAG: hypothetical protein QOJ33_1175, partial [Chloroflexota bacterium]|nr:hypothetical protein [Chloroflexota bacterium]
MSIEPEGWHIDASPPSWDPEAKTFSFFLHKPGHEQFPVIATISSDPRPRHLSYPDPMIRYTDDRS